MMIEKTTLASQDYILRSPEPPLTISSSETLCISFLMSDGPPTFSLSSDNVVVKAIHLQATET